MKLLNTIAKILLPLVLGGAILYWMYRGFDFHRISHVLFHEMNWTWMLLSFPFGILAQMFRGWRWRQTLEPLGETTRASVAVNSIFLSYAVSLVIPRIGEFARCGTLKRWDGVSFAKALGTVVTERAVDTLTIMLYSGLVLLIEMSVFGTFFKKTGTAPVVAEFGLEARDNGATAGANGFGFGNNRIYYLGDEAQYLTDTKADVAKAVAAAKNTLASVPANYLTVKLQRYVDNAEKAETAKELQNALFGIQEITSRLAAMTNSVGGIFADDPKASRKADGVYTLQGVKLADSADHLKAGLYIVNGKKILVK